MVTSSTKAYLIQRQNDCIAHVKKESVEAQQQTILHATHTT